MSKHVAFLRAINVGGRGLVRMTDLCAAFERAGGLNVRTIIQSGNVLFEAPAQDVAGVITRARNGLRRNLGIEPEIIWRSLSQITAFIEGAPFRDLRPGPTIKLYVTFLARKARVIPALPLVSSSEALEVVRINLREVFIVSRPKRRGFFGFPNNFIEEQFRVPATTRNWSTITKIVGLATNQTDG